MICNLKHKFELLTSKSIWKYYLYITPTLEYLCLTNVSSDPETKITFMYYSIYDEKSN